MSVIEASLRGKGWTAFFSRHVTTREVVLMQRLFDLRRYAPLTGLFLVASRLGDGPLWWVSGLVLLAVGSGPTRWAVLGAALASLLSVVLFMAVKNLIGRPRPFETWCDLPCLLAPPDRFSFPSGHTMTAFAVCANYAVLVPGSELFFFPVALLIGLSRVFLGCHYPTDVLAGAALGSGIGLGNGRLLAALAGLQVAALSGDRFCSLIRSNGSQRDVPILFYSSNDEDSLRHSVNHFGASGHVCKGDIAGLRRKVAMCWRPDDLP